MVDFISQYWYILFGLIGGGTYLFFSLRHRGQPKNHPSTRREGEARKISSSPFFYKRILPVIFGVGALLILAGEFSAAGNVEPYDYEQILIPSGMFVIFAVVWWFTYARLVDEVWDHGNELVIVKGDYKIRIPLTEIAKVSYATISKDPRVVITLFKPGVLGSQIAFLPPSGLFSSDKAMIAEDLIHRIGKVGK